MRRGEIGSIGKDGIKFNRNFIDSTQIDSLKKDVAELQVNMKITLECVHDIELATMRLQIMSDNTDIHTIVLQKHMHIPDMSSILVYTVKDLQ